MFSQQSTRGQADTTTTKYVFSAAIPREQGCAIALGLLSKVIPAAMTL